jgi:hypothetical protein
MTTWGDEEDFKHFLPGILELMYNGCYEMEERVILTKVLSAGFATWSAAEQKSIQDFAVLLWYKRLAAQDFLFLDDLHDAISLFNVDCNKLCEELLNDNSEESFRSLISVLDPGAHFSNDSSNTSIFQAAKFSDTFQAKIEQAFFDHCEADPAFAAQISRCEQAFSFHY